MKRCLFSLLCTVFFVESYSQTKPTLFRSWIKTQTENLSGQPLAPDTLYTRYTFAKSGEVRFSFYPGWDDYKQAWSQNANNLTIGFDTYRIEESTDTSLTIAIDGFRRFRFLSEEYLANKEENLASLGDYNGKPLYKANRYITPRYKKEKLRDEIQRNVEGLHGKEAAYFLATFIVTTEGKVENIKIVHGLGEGFDREITKQLLKTSRQWQPAVVGGQPVQTEMMYDIKYLKSLIPYSSGRLN